MNKLFLSLSILFCLLHGQSVAQKPGAVRWSRLTNPSPYSDTIHSIRVQSDGKLVVAGNSYRGSYRVIAVGRYVGSVLDSSFGTNGIVTTPLDSAHTAAKALELQPDGKITVAGGYRKGPAGDFILARYNQDGSADSSFGINGIVRTDIRSDSSDVATALAIQTDGRIVTAGRSGSLLAMCRYNADGSLDSSFDSDGMLTVAAAAGATCMKLQTDGRMVVCCGGVVIRLMPDGSPDNSFGVNGVATLVHSALGMAVQNDGKILLSGDGYEFVLQRLDTAGVLDNSFGAHGIVITKGFVTTDHRMSATSVLLQADGRILAGGWVQTSMGSSFTDFAVARYESNGAPDGSFGVAGKVANNVFSEAKSLTAAINNNNELVLAGIGNYTFEWAMAAYYLGPPLAVHTVPGVGGQISVAPNPAEDFARIQSTHIENGTWHLSLCDLTGRTLYSEMVVARDNTLDKSISLIGLPPAMYLVKLDNGVSRMTVKLAKSR